MAKRLQDSEGLDGDDEIDLRKMFLDLNGMKADKKDCVVQ
jgi:hypothetical protein